MLGSRINHRDLMSAAISPLPEIVRNVLRLDIQNAPTPGMPDDLPRPLKSDCPGSCQNARSQLDTL